MNMTRRSALLTCVSIAPSLVKFLSENDASGNSLFAKWWCQLNCWEWPVEWGNPPERIRHKLEDLRGRLRYECCKVEYHDLMAAIQNIAGLEAINDCWRENYIIRRH